jgi:hypothetical protein
MKIEYRIPPPAMATLRTPLAESIRGDHAYAPLSRADLLARRIDVRPQPRVELRRHRWKRDDESVN